MGEQSHEAQGPAGANSQLSFSESVPLDNLNFSEHISSFQKKKKKGQKHIFHRVFVRLKYMCMLSECGPKQRGHCSPECLEKRITHRHSQGCGLSPSQRPKLANTVRQPFRCAPATMPPKGHLLRDMSRCAREPGSRHDTLLTAPKRRVWESWSGSPRPCRLRSTSRNPQGRLGEGSHRYVLAAEGVAQPQPVSRRCGAGGAGWRL